MFRAVSLPIIRSFHCTFGTGTCYTGLTTISILILHASCRQACITYASAECTVETPDDGQRNCPKHVELRTRINLEISASVVFIVKKFVTMHGHMNVKGVFLVYVSRNLFS